MEGDEEELRNLLSPGKRTTQQLPGSRRASLDDAPLTQHDQAPPPSAHRKSTFEVKRCLCYIRVVCGEFC